MVRDIQRNNTYIDGALDVADYGNSVAGVRVLGADTTASSVALCAVQAGRLLFTPNTVKKPVNESLKIGVSALWLGLGVITGEKRTASFFDVASKALIDIAIGE